MLPLHNHSEYSALDGYSRPDEIADRIQELGLPGAFLTDHGTVAGLTAFRNAMTWKNPKKKEGPRDLFVGYGMEAYQSQGSRADTKWDPDSHMFYDPKLEGKHFTKGQDEFHLLLLATTAEGYRNLLRLSDAAHRTGFYYNARVDYALLEKYQEGLICTSACAGSLPCQELVKKGTYSSFEALGRIFGDRFYVEISTYDTDFQRELNQDLVSLADDRGWPLVYANDAHYATPDLYDIHEALICAQYQEQYNEPKKYSNVLDDPARHHPPCLYVMGEDEVRARLGNHLPESVVDEAVGNSDAIMEMCRFELEKPGLYLPKFKVDAEEYDDSGVMLESLVIDGLERLYGYEDASDDLWEEAVDRAKFELEAIVSAGLQDYFLIVWDYINYALRQGVMVGPGRGSVGGSILAYCLGITSIDPLKYNLQFERFWNPGRADGLPDIDVDFEQSSRQFMIGYAKKKYGPDRVLPIGNHIFLRPKSAIDKSGPVLYGRGNVPYGSMTIIKQIIDTTTDAGQQATWDEMMEMVGSDLRGETDHTGLNKTGINFIKQYEMIFELAEALAGRLSTYGVHASAVVISDVDLNDRLPARMASDDDKHKVIVTQAEMKEVEKEGFPKFDFLGLRNLDTIVMAAIYSGDFGDADVLGPKLLKFINERRSGSVEYVDKDLREALVKVIKLFREDTNYDYLPPSFWEQADNGHTLGLFQIDESPSPKRIAKKLKMRSIEDLAFVVALNRPGPLRGGVVDRFLARRAGEEEVTYPHEMLSEILKPTYGDFLYQEQVIAFFREIGYSLSDADHIRKMLGKKLVQEMKEEYPNYLTYATQFMPEHTAKAIWDSIEDFSKYSFNKAHAVGYGIILAWTMYAKWKWPTEFIMASITTNPKRVGEYINEARRIDVPVLPPDSNRSEVTISKDGHEILYGLRDIKGIGEDAAQWVIDHAPYKSPEDFYDRASAEKPVVVKSNHRQAFMDAGCFDSFGYRLAKCEDCEGKGRRRIDPASRLLDDCPDCGKTGYIRVDLPGPKEIGEFEEELLGIVVSDIYAGVISKYEERISALDPLSAAESEEKGSIVIPGVITKVVESKVRADAKYNANAKFATVWVTWKGDEVKFKVWPKHYNGEHGWKWMLSPGTVGEFTLKTGSSDPEMTKGRVYR